MKWTRFHIRRILLTLVILGVFGIFIARLINIQIVSAEELMLEMTAGSVSEQTVKATRGEIVDRELRPMVSNTLGYDVTIDKVSFPNSRSNEIILDLIRLCEKNGEEWNDGLPISLTQPFRFNTGRDDDGREVETADVTRLKDTLKIQSYTDVDDTFFHIVERYNLGPDPETGEERYTVDEQRKIAGVRYEMERRGFNIQVLYTFASDINIDLVLQIKERSDRFPGVDIQERGLRHYDMGTIAPHVIGRVGPIYEEQLQELVFEKGYERDDIVGKDGIEAAYEDELRGRNGKRVITTDANGRVISAEETVVPEPGHTVVLSIDARMQDLLQKALERQIIVLQNTALPGKGKEADVGAAVVVDCKTGEVLAAATYPSFDQVTFPQDYARLSSDEKLPLYNRAIMGVYAPGSIFKPVVSTAGLSTGTITENSTYYCGMVYNRFATYKPRCLDAHGNINVVNALRWSCNIFYYETGFYTGIDAIDRTAMQYGLGEPTGIRLNEKIGHRSNPETFKITNPNEVWDDGSVIQSSIGQLVALYSPLQLANYAATIGNRGERMDLTFVKEIRDYSRKEIVEAHIPEVAARVDAQPEHFETVVKGMVAASRIGTARAHFGTFYPIDVASKTGTPEAEMLNSTFICFAPADDPVIAIAVVIENGYHGYTGAPVARAIVDDYFGFANPNALVKPEELLGYVSDADLAAAAAGELPLGSSDLPVRQPAQQTAPPAASQPEEPSQPVSESSADSGASRAPTVPNTAGRGRPV